MFALFKDGKQVSKAHPHRLTVATEAYQRGLMSVGSPDFASHGDCRTVALSEGYEIKEVEQD